MTAYTLDLPTIENLLQETEKERAAADQELKEILKALELGAICG